MLHFITYGYALSNSLWLLTPMDSSIGWEPRLMKWRLLVRIFYFPLPWGQLHIKKKSLWLLLYGVVAEIM
jgi:hypothetical protein